MQSYRPKQYRKRQITVATDADHEVELENGAAAMPAVQFKVIATPAATAGKQTKEEESNYIVDPEIKLQHQSVVQNLAKYKEYLDEGKARVFDAFFLKIDLPNTVDYVQTQAAIQSEASIYDEISKKGKAELKGNYTIAANSLAERFASYQKFDAYKKKIGEHMAGWVVSIHDLLNFERASSYYGLFPTSNVANQINLTAARDPLYRLLQMTFPFSKERNALFNQLYSQDLETFVEQKTKFDDFTWPMARAYLKAGKLRPADKFYIAVKGAGTDEGNVNFSMKQAYDIGIQKLETEYSTDYASDTEGKGALPITGAVNNWYIAGRIDDDMDWTSDDNIKAKAILCYGRVRPVDKIRMALFGDKNITDLQNAIREGIDEGMTGEQIEGEYTKSFGNAEKTKSGWSLKEEIKDFYNSTKELNYSFGDKEKGKKIESEFSKVDDILSGKESLVQRFVHVFQTDEKKAFPIFCKMDLSAKKLVTDTFIKINYNDDKLNKYKVVYNLQYSNDPGFQLITEGSLWDYDSFKSYVRYSISQGSFNVLRKSLKGNDYLEEMLVYMFLPSKEKDKNEFLNLLKIESDIQFFLHIINSKDREWSTHYLLHLLPEDRKQVFKAHWNYFKNETYVSDKKHLRHVEDLLWDDPTARIKEERRLLRKANSGLGAALTNMGSTAGLSASNEMREVEVDLEIAKFDDGTIDKEEMAGLEEGIKNAKETRANFEETRDKVEGIATMIVQALVAATASALLPGLGGIIASGLISGATSVVTNKIMKNERYDLNNCGMDFVTGMVDGMMGGLATKGIAKIAKGTGFAAQVMKVKIINEVAEQALGSIHSLGIDIAKGVPPGESFENYFKGMFQSMVVSRVTAPYQKALDSVKKTIVPPKNTSSDTLSHQNDVVDPSVIAHDGNTVNSTNGQIEQPSATLHTDMPQHGSAISDPIHYQTDPVVLSDSLTSELTHIDIEKTSIEAKINAIQNEMTRKGKKPGRSERKELESMEADLHDLTKKQKAAEEAYALLNNEVTRDTVLEAQQALRDIRDMKLYRSGEEVILHDVPEGAIYLDPGGDLIRSESQGKRTMEDVFNNDPQREVGLWRDNNTDPPTYFVVQGSSFNVDFNSHGNYDLVHHTHPSRGHSVLDSLASMGDFRHLIRGKSPKNPQYLESSILTHQSGEILESRFIATSSGNGKWEFKIEYTKRDGSRDSLSIDPDLIVNRKEKEYNELVNKKENEEAKLHSSSKVTAKHKAVTPEDLLSDQTATEQQPNENEFKDNENTQVDVVPPHGHGAAPERTGPIDPKNLDIYTDREIVAGLEQIGTWDEIHNFLNQTPEGKKILDRMTRIRKKIVQDLDSYNAELLGDASSTPTSDLDFNVTSENAGRMLVLLDSKLRKMYGSNYEKIFKVSLFTHAGRLTKYANHKDSKAFAGIDARIHAKSEVLMYARMLHHAKGNPAEMIRVERLIKGLDTDLIQRWADKLGDNDRNNYYKLLQEVDALEVRYNKASDRDKPILAELISAKQMEANFFNKEAYLAPGAMMKSYDKSQLGHKQSILSQVEMIGAKINEYNQSGGDVTAEYEVYKYISRCKKELQELGIPIPPEMEIYFTLADTIYRTDRNYYKLNQTPKSERLIALYSFLQTLQNLSQSQ